MHSLHSTSPKASRGSASLHIIYASTSGNTEYVIDVLCAYLSEHAPDIVIERQRAELAQSADLLRGDYLILGSGTWNTGGVEGQLNMYMHRLLKERSADLDLHGRPVTTVSLGDDRYYYRTRCTEHFLRFIREHHGALFLLPFVLVNEPYDQDEKIQRWGQKLIDCIHHAAPVHTVSVS